MAKMACRPRTGCMGLMLTMVDGLLLLLGVVDGHLVVRMSASGAKR